MRYSLPSLGTGYHIQSATVRMNYATYEDMDTGDYVAVDLYAVRSTRTWTEMGANWYTMKREARNGARRAAKTRHSTGMTLPWESKSSTGPLGAAIRTGPTAISRK